MAVYYHVTFAENASSIQSQGILTGRKGVWHSGMGKPIGDARSVYLFPTQTSAARWAAKQEWEFEKPTAIVVVVDPPGTMKADENVEIQFYKGVVLDRAVPASCIRAVVPLTPEMRRDLVQKNEVTFWTEDLTEARRKRKKKTPRFVRGVYGYIGYPLDSGGDGGGGDV